MAVQRTSPVEVIARCRQAGLKIIVGGPLFTIESDAFPEVDHFVLKEAELTLPAGGHRQARSSRLESRSHNKWPHRLSYPLET
jgi:hypothetical protein